LYRFFVENSQINEITKSASIIGNDVNHIKNVLRMKVGEQITLSDGELQVEYLCQITDFDNDEVHCEIIESENKSSELPVKVILFQGLPKQDKLETIVQKTVELGVGEIVPVRCHRSVVKLDDKKVKNKTERWNAIALAAAKQSKRSVIPEVLEVMNYGEALDYAKEKCDVVLLPYEHADSSRDAMEETRKILGNITEGATVGIFVGPEGGFEDNEVEKALSINAEVITLGKRILRTETAPLVLMSWIVLTME